jgi:hypothetical protein
MRAPAGDNSSAGAASGWQGDRFLRSKPMDRPDLAVIVPVKTKLNCSKGTTKKLLDSKKIGVKLVKIDHVKIVSIIGRIGLGALPRRKNNYISYFYISTQSLKGEG